MGRMRRRGSSAPPPHAVSVSQSLLFGISPLDPITFTAMPLVLAAAAMLASYLSARRAIAVDPTETLRAE